MAYNLPLITLTILSERINYEVPHWSLLPDNSFKNYELNFPTFVLQLKKTLQKSKQKNYLTENGTHYVTYSVCSSINVYYVDIVSLPEQVAS